MHAGWEKVNPTDCIRVPYTDRGPQLAARALLDVLHPGGEEAMAQVRRKDLDTRSHEGKATRGSRPSTAGRARSSASVGSVRKESAHQAAYPRCRCV
jgi:hypothetical protein